MEKVNIRHLTTNERERFADRWQAVQSSFVDDPAGTIREADRLVVEIMVARGYPMVEFEGRAEDLSVDHPLVVSHYRTAHEIASQSPTRRIIPKNRNQNVEPCNPKNSPHCGSRQRRAKF
jgi:hypothetical protein